MKSNRPHPPSDRRAKKPRIEEVEIALEELGESLVFDNYVEILRNVTASVLSNFQLTRPLDEHWSRVYARGWKYLLMADVRNPFTGELLAGARSFLRYAALRPPEDPLHYWQMAYASCSAFARNFLASIAYRLDPYTFDPHFAALRFGPVRYVGRSSLAKALAQTSGADPFTAEDPMRLVCNTNILVMAQPTPIRIPAIRYKRVSDFEQDFFPRIIEYFELPIATTGWTVASLLTALFERQEDDDSWGTPFFQEGHDYSFSPLIHLTTIRPATGRWTIDVAAGLLRFDTEETALLGHEIGGSPLIEASKRLDIVMTMSDQGTLTVLETLTIYLHRIDMDTAYAYSIGHALSPGNAFKAFQIPQESATLRLREAWEEEIANVGLNPMRDWSFFHRADDTMTDAAFLELAARLLEGPDFFLDYMLGKIAKKVMRGSRFVLFKRGRQD
jgi:hypothetical protein